MRFLRTLIFATASLLLVVSAWGQDPNVKQFAKDGLSFDYPAKWQIADKSSGQMQFLELAQGDVVIRIRSPREWLKTPEKEAHARKLFQDQYVDEFSNQLEQAGMHPKRSAVTTQIGGSAAEGVRVQAVLGSEPGEAAIFWNTVGERLVVLTFFGPDKARKKATPTWDIIRNSLKIEPPQPKPTPSPKGKP